jgi:hypothetical protein
MVFFDLRVPFLGVLQLYKDRIFNLQLRLASRMIIRFGHCALCNTLCWVTLLRVEGRLRGGWGGHDERDKGELRSRAGERVSSPEREKSASLPRRASLRVISDVVVATLLLMYHSLIPARLISSINCSRMP